MAGTKEESTMKPRSYTVVYEAAEEGGYYAHVPALGITTEGESLRDAKRMARDAIGGYIEAAKAIGKPLPRNKGVRVEEVEVSA